MRRLIRALVLSVRFKPYFLVFSNIACWLRLRHMGYSGSKVFVTHANSKASVRAVCAGADSKGVGRELQSIRFGLKILFSRESLD